MPETPITPRAEGHLPRALIILSIGCFLGGCSQVYTVKVDAMRTPDVAPRQSYHIVSADPYRDTSEASFVKAAALVDRALEANGMFAASRPEWADMVVELDFGVGPRRHISVPDKEATRSGATAIFVPDRGGGSIGEATGTYVPTAALTRVIAVWEKRLSLVARENRTENAGTPRSGAELWRVDVSIQDESSTLDGLLPILAASLVDSIDRDTEPRTLRRISDRAPATLLVTQSH